MEFITIQCMVPNKNEVKEIKTALLTQKLAACISSIENVQSSFSWQGEICEEKEFLLIIKTKQTLFSQVEAVIKEIHSYNVPEIIALPIIECSDLYRQWLEAETL